MSNPVVFDLEEALSAPEGGEQAAGDTPAKPEAQAPDTSREDALKEALRISESARQEMAARMAPQSQQPQQQAPPQVTREQLTEMLNSEDPAVRLQAIEINTQQTLAAAASHFENRLAPLTDSGVHSAKNIARSQFPVEFELFGDQIEELAKNVPNRAALTQPEGWAHIVRYVRGDASNAMKYAEHSIAQRAREQQMQNVGPSFTPTPNSGQGQHFQLDAATKEIAQTLIDAGVYKDMNEYARDMKAFNNYANG